ncbi:hypothetical protein PSTG_12038 [Puccinia striiformis f. sp. tritici PST-78]|uniref:Uncharacterized protein n=1 Tax=Puccinia striiformis f. sp. tritici PST-78 TaxID=1165861 RepID=A0A0L0V5J9_9BASI|nr:hypothetical protein PSTG_12038 [Puccinia striiformis f. sp. tritici PST-78]
MYCIDCGATPVRLGNWCQSCVNVWASIPSTLPAVAFQPPRKKSTLPAVAIQPPMNKPKSAHEIMRLKRQEAIQQALSFQSNAIPNPVTQSQLSQNLAIANSQAVMAQFSAPGSQVGPYESARLSRMKPYNHPQVIKGAKAPKGPASKGIISSVITPQKMSVPCGFEMWYKGRFTTGQAVIRTNQFILWADPTSFSSLINTLCNTYNGSVELVTGPNKDRAKFVTEHFPYCRLGLQRSGSVEDYESFVDFLKREKAIDLRFDRDAFIRDQLDLKELNGMKDATQKYSL